MNLLPRLKELLLYPEDDDSNFFRNAYGCLQELWVIMLREIVTLILYLTWAIFIWICSGTRTQPDKALRTWRLCWRSASIGHIQMKESPVQTLFAFRSLLILFLLLWAVRTPPIHPSGYNSTNWYSWQFLSSGTSEYYVTRLLIQWRADMCLHCTFLLVHMWAI